MALTIPADMAHALAAAGERVPVRKLPDGRAMGLPEQEKIVERKKFWNVCHGCGLRHETQVLPAPHCPKCEGSRIRAREFAEPEPLQYPSAAIGCACRSCGLKWRVAASKDIVERARYLRCPRCNGRKIKLDGVGRLCGKGGRFLVHNVAKLNYRVDKQQEKLDRLRARSQRATGGKLLVPFTRLESREHQWEQSHRDELARGANAKMREWTKTLSEKQRVALDEPARRGRRGLERNA